MITPINAYNYHEQYNIKGIAAVSKTHNYAYICLLTDRIIDIVDRGNSEAGPTRLILSDYTYIDVCGRPVDWKILLKNARTLQRKHQRKIFWHKIWRRITK